MTFCADFDALRAAAADVRVVTSDGRSIAAHSYVLVSRLCIHVSSLFSFPVSSGDGRVLLCASLLILRFGIWRRIGLGVAGAGADDRQGAARVGRRVHHPRPRRPLRRRPRLPPLPLRLQVIQISNSLSGLN